MDIMKGYLAIHIGRGGHMITISCHVLISRIEKRGPIHIGNDGNLLTISCYSLINMMEGCLPIRIGSNADMPTIFCNFLMNMGGKCCANLMISLKITWRDGY